MHPVEANKFIAKAERFLQSSVEESWRWGRVTGKKIVFQVILDKFHQYVATNSERKVIRDEAMFLGSYQPIGIYLRVIREIVDSDSYEEFSPEGKEVIQKLLRMLEATLPYAKGVDYSRLRLYKGLGEGVRSGDERKFGQLWDTYKSDHQGGMLVSSLSEHERREILNGIDRLSEKCVDEIQALEPNGYFFLPSGPPHHETKTLIKKNADGSFELHHLDTQGTPRTSYRIKSEEMTPELIAGILKYKVFKMGGQQLPLEEFEAIPDVSWGCKADQGSYSNSCAVKSLSAMIKTLFYLSFEGREEGALEYKLLTSLLNDALLAQYGSKLDSTTAVYAQIKTNIRRRYRTWRPIVVDNELFSAAVDGFRKKILSLKGDDFSTFTPTADYLASHSFNTPSERMRCLEEHHQELIQALISSGEVSLQTSLSIGPEVGTLFSPAYSAATLEQYRMSRVSKNLLEFFEDEASLSTRVLRAVTERFPLFGEIHDYITRADDNEYLMSPLEMVTAFLDVIETDMARGSSIIGFEELCEKILSQKIQHPAFFEKFVLEKLYFHAVAYGHINLIDRLGRALSEVYGEREGINFPEEKVCLRVAKASSWDISEREKKLELYIEGLCKNSLNDRDKYITNLFGLIKIFNSENFYHEDGKDRQYSKLVEGKILSLMKDDPAVFNNELFLREFSSCMKKSSLSKEMLSTFVQGFVQHSTIGSSLRAEILFKTLAAAERLGEKEISELIFREIALILDGEDDEVFTNEALVDRVANYMYGSPFLYERRVPFLMGLSAHNSVSSPIYIDYLLRLLKSSLYAEDKELKIMIQRQLVGILKEQHVIYESDNLFEKMRDIIRFPECKELRYMCIQGLSKLAEVNFPKYIQRLMNFSGALVGLLDKEESIALIVPIIISLMESRGDIFENDAFVDGMIENIRENEYQSLVQPFITALSNHPSGDLSKHVNRLVRLLRNNSVDLLPRIHALLEEHGLQILDKDSYKQLEKLAQMARFKDVKSIELLKSNLYSFVDKQDVKTLNNDRVIGLLEFAEITGDEAAIKFVIDLIQRLINEQGPQTFRMNIETYHLDRLYRLSPVGPFRETVQEMFLTKLESISSSRGWVDWTMMLSGYKYFPEKLKERFPNEYAENLIRVKNHGALYGISQEGLQRLEELDKGEVSISSGHPTCSSSQIP